MNAHETVVFLVGVLSWVGCSRVGTDLSGNDSGARPPSVGPWAANASGITRFQDELPFGPVATVRNDHTAVRQAPDDGKVVATLASRASVVKLSKHADEDLIAFEDPRANGQRLMGWVPESALDDAAHPPAPPDDGGGEDVDEPPPCPPEPEPGPAPGPRHHHHRPHHP
jgi:hypothetical protein